MRRDAEPAAGKPADNAADHAHVLIPPPLAWALAFFAALGLDRLYPLRFLPPNVPRLALGGAVLLAGFALALWAAGTFRRAGTGIVPHKPSTALVARGPYRFTRNPIYLGMFIGQAGFALGFDSLWMLVLLAPFYLVIRYGVVRREEAYLARKFGEAYRAYQSRVRRWL